MKLILTFSVQIRSRLFFLMTASGLLLCPLRLYAQGQQLWQSKSQSIFGADIERDEAGDPILHFVGSNSVTDHVPTNGRVSFILFRGQPAFKVWCAVQHAGFGRESGSVGGVVITKDAVFYEVESGSKDYSSVDNVEVRSEGRVKISVPMDRYIHINMRSDKKKVTVDVGDFGSGYGYGYYRETKQRELSGFLSQLVDNFESTLNTFENAAGISDPEVQLSPGARFHGLTKEEIAANIAERKAQLKAQDEEDKARRASEGGGGLTTLTAIFTGIAQGMSDQNNTPILSVGNQQAAAIRAIGNSKVMGRQQPAQGVAAQVAATQQSLQAIPQIQDRGETMSGKSSAFLTSGTGSPVSGAVDSASVPEPSSDGSAHYLASLPSGCIGQFWDPKYYNWLSFQNNCGQAIHLSWIAASQSDSFGMSAADLAPGATSNSGWNQSEVQRKAGFLFFVCPGGYVPVDATTDQVVSRANQLFRCIRQ